MHFFSLAYNTFLFVRIKRLWGRRPTGFWLWGDRPHRPMESAPMNFYSQLYSLL